MATLFSKLLAPDIQMKLAKESAVQIARGVGSKVNANQRVIIGEPYCPYKIPMHTKDFWGTVFVSDVSYNFTANHRRPTKAIWNLADYSVSLKDTKATSFSRPKLLPEISRVMGTKVYAWENRPEDYFKQRILSDRLKSIFKKIDFNLISEFVLCPLSLRVISSFRFAPQCAEQAQVFRELIVSAFEEAKERQQISGSA